MKISKRTSRVMALLMTVVMLLGIMPLSVFAAEGDVVSVTSAKNDGNFADAAIEVNGTLTIKLTNGSTHNPKDYTVAIGNDDIAEVTSSETFELAEGATTEVKVKGLAKGSTTIVMQGTGSGSPYTATVNLTVSATETEGNGPSSSTSVTIETSKNSADADATANVEIVAGQKVIVNVVNGSSNERTYQISASEGSDKVSISHSVLTTAADEEGTFEVSGLAAGTAKIELESQNIGESWNPSIYYGVVNVTITGSGTTTPENPDDNGSVSNIGFTSDMHDQDNNLRNWLTGVQANVDPDLEYMAFGGDFTYNGSVTSFNNAVAVVNELVGLNKGVYTTGNHEYDESSVAQQMASTKGFVRSGLAVDAPNYDIYCLGAHSGDGTGSFQDSDITALSNYLKTAPTDEPIFIVTHYPLHYFSWRTIGNADDMIDLLNDYPNVIFVWGHNHSQGDPAYGDILTAGDSITYASGRSEEINFTYLSAGAMRGDREPYYGLVANVSTEGDTVVLTYYGANGVETRVSETIEIGAGSVPDEPEISVEDYTKVDTLANGEYIIVIGENRGLTNQTGATVSGSNSYAGLKSNKVIIAEDKITDGVTDGMIWTITVNNGKITIQNENSKYLTADYGSGNTGNTRKLLLADTADANWVYTEGKLNNTSQNVSQTGDYSGCYLYQTDNTTDYTISVRSLKNASNVTFYKVNRASSEEHEHTYGAITYTGDGKTSYVAVRECTCGDKQTTTAVISYAVTTPASCTAAGVGTYTANFAEEWAQDKDTTEAIAQLGHNYGELIAKVDPIHTATELKAGKEAHYVCSACEKFFNEEKVETTEAALVIAAPTHTYGTAWESDATNHWHECECGAKSGVAVHTPGEAATETTAQKCTVCQYVIKPATGHITHIYSVFVSETPATCTQTGSKVMKCTGCELTETTTLEINSSNHTYGDLVEKVDAVHTATELKAGKEAHYKCDCGKFFTDAKVETTEDELVIAAPVHSIAEFVSETPATCTQTGSKVMKCTGCDKNETTTLEIDSSNHTYGELIEKVDAVHTATELKAGKEAHYECACGKFFTEAKVETTEDELVIPAPTHSFEAWENNEEQHWHECECGATDTAANHDFTNGDCVCGKVAPAEDIEEIYIKVDNLINGQYVIVVGDDSALGTTTKTAGSTNGSNAYVGFAPKEVTISGNKIIDGVEDDMIWTVTVNGGKISIKNDKENKYLAADYGSQNYGNTRKLTLETTADSNWKYEDSLLSNTAENSGNCYLTLYTDGTIIIRSDSSATPKTVTFYKVGTGTVDPEQTVLTDIEVTSNPNKMTYVAGEDFDATGMVITAIYSNGSEKVVTDYTVSGGEDMTAGQKTITITFAEGGIEKTVTLTVTVNTEAPSNPGDTVYVAFSSDVHNSGSATNSGTSAYRLNTWLNNVSTKIGATFENMAFCGDNGSANTYDSNTYWNYVQEAMNVVANSNKVEGEGIFIAGNHEYQNGSFGSTSNATAAKIKTIGYTENTSDYAIYVFGAASGSQSFNTSDINNLSTWLKNNANGDKPVFVVSHYPIHYFNSRTTDNAQALVSVLNEYPNVVFLWGHNHTLSDSHYDKVHAAGSQLQLTSSSSSKVEINFTYAAAGCMSGSEYNAASESIIGKGLVAKITDGKLVSLTYYKADGSVVSTYNHDGSNTPDIPDTPELGDKIVIISNGHVLTTAKGTDYTNTGSSSSQKYNYSGLAGEPYVEGMEYTEDMLWVMEDAGNGYFYLKNGNQYLNGSYVSNSTGGYDGSLSLGEKNDKWIWQDGMLKSYNASQGHDTGDKFLTHGNTSGGNPDVNTFTVRSGDNVNGSTEFEEAAPTEPTEHEHTWGNVVYTFAADGLTCTAQRVCSTNASHVETATATITSEVKTPATCTIMGTTTYTATFTEEWAKTRTKEVQDIPVLGHEWSDAEYTFAADGLTCSAQRVCANDESHVDTAEAVITSEVKIAATCEEKGTTTYTATFEEEWAEVQTKDVQDIAALEHKWGSAEYTFAADGSICVAKRVCENDPSHVQNAVAVITSEVKTPASCMEMGTTTYTATFTETWAGTQIKDIQNIPAIGIHSYKDGVCEVCGEIELKWQLGDVDHDGDVDNSDVEYLLWYTLFPEDYPTEDFVDFDHSGEVDNKDVEYLLWYTLFPEDYPLTAERNN